ncbi:MAG TPA: DUF4062 domain-containing protein [Chitinophagales bacterium]|nr:DUF4062 domain-containing protein [Chitinophagales bacterium]
MIPPKPVIFISSTIEDLHPERKAALDAVTKMKCVPRMSEITFEAVSKGSVTACIDEVKSSDFYILIIGSRYGYELPNGISITEFEFDTAFKERKPTFVFNMECEKELKQGIFEKKVGSLFFYKTVKDAQQLEAEIIRALNKYFEEQQYQKTIQTEELYTDLLEVSFPEKLFHADLDIDRAEVIRKTKGTERPLNKKAETRHVIYAALKQNGVYAINDFNYSEGKLYTFQNLHDEKNPLRTIVDIGTIEQDNAADFYKTNNDYLNIFKSLLHQCLVRKLLTVGVKWQHETKLFYFTPVEETPDKREVSWHSKKDATRTVFEATYKNNKPEEMLHGKHLAFRERFFFFEDKWYLGIFPEWFFSFDGARKSFYSAKQIIYLKKKERNNQVFNHLKFIVYILKYFSQADLFKQTYQYEILKFGNLKKLSSYPSIDDNLWHPKEEKEFGALLLDKEASIPLSFSS